MRQYDRALQAILRKHVEDFGWQWDRCPPGHLWTYHNSPHQSTGERSSFLVFGVDCHSPSEAHLLPPSVAKPRKFDDCQEELVPSLSTARSKAVSCIKTAHVKYKKSYYTQPGRLSSESDSGFLSGYLVRKQARIITLAWPIPDCQHSLIWCLSCRGLLSWWESLPGTPVESVPMFPPLSSRILLVRWTPTKSRTSPQWDWLSGA